ncbi:hypothetical protein BC835DRAFT_606949 [Cytidiella melzeri]|nr:hypothetical protein BC835DRAFT_606949 [Cytidiella melzeri]
MVDWRSPEVELFCMSLYEKMVVFFLGAFSWFFLESWNVVEGALITRRMKLAPTHFPYLFARYGQLTTLILICVLLHLPIPIVTSCKMISLPRAATVVGNLTLVAASVNLGLRAFTLWKDHWMIRMMIIRSGKHIIPYAHSLRTPSRRLSLGFTFTAQRNILPSNDSLLSVLMAQGVGYAVIIWLTSIPMTVSILLDLNVAMNVFLSTPGCTVSVIVSCQMVIALLKLKDGEDGGETSPTDGNSSESTPTQLSTNINLTEYDCHLDDVASVSVAAEK